MTTAPLIILDHVVTLLCTAAWFTTAAMLAMCRHRPALALLATAVPATLARVGAVVVLAGRGWWFVQEKVLLGLPLLVATAAVAVVLVGGRLRRGEGATPGGLVAVFTAAYAALAGLVVTLVAGYPLTAGTALITLGLVGAGALLTARMAVPLAEAGAPGERAVSRRRFLGWSGGAAVVAATGGGTGLSFLPPEEVSTGGGAAPSSPTAVSVADLRGPDAPAPGGRVRRHEITARKATVTLASGREIEAWTYDGRVPGPAITATEGDLIEVRLRNADIDDGVTLHWHGYDVPCGEDGAPGVTQATVAPGEEFTYRFLAAQVGTYWYHTHHASHVGVHKGLYGTLVVRPRAEGERLDLTLPVHTFDGVTVIADADGPSDHIATPGTTVRLRVINTDSDPRRITLSGTAFRVVAADGRDLTGPGEVEGLALVLPAGGRRDLALTMPDGPVVLLVGDDPDGGVRLLPREGTAVEPPDTTGWPELDLLEYGTPAPVPFGARDADRRFTMVLDRGLAIVDGQPAFAQTVNGRGHPSIPDQLVAGNEVVVLTIVNRGLETHPWHLHGHPVLVLTRDGVAAGGSPLWLDSFDVRPGEVWEVAFHATNPGIWMNHCHNLPHQHQGMMLRLRYDGVTTPFGGGSAHAH